jgi:hypothetical protein
MFGMLTTANCLSTCRGPGCANSFVQTILPNCSAGLCMVGLVMLHMHDCVHVMLTCRSSKLLEVDCF